MPRSKKRFALPDGPATPDEMNSAKEREKCNRNYAGGALSVMCQKTRLCTYYLKGSCPRERFCKFAHGEEELQAAPDLTHTKMCPSLLKSGACTTGPSCKFAHREDELRSIVEVAPEPALAAALLAVWQERERSGRLNEFSTDATDGVQSEQPWPEDTDHVPRCQRDAQNSRPAA